MQMISSYCKSEFRQAYKKSNLVSDLSYNNDGKNSNTHLFAYLNGNIDETSSYKLNYQGVSNDNYLKIHNFQTLHL